MLYTLLCKDKPGSLKIRMDTRPAHLEHLDDLNGKGTLKMAGPFLDGDGNANGSLLIVDADDAAAARRLAEADPYAKAGLFETIDVRPFRWTINNPDA
ncbi:MAG: YciI-like protein [Pararhizobium sp.]